MAARRIRTVKKAASKKAVAKGRSATPPGKRTGQVRKAATGSAKKVPSKKSAGNSTTGNTNMRTALSGRAGTSPSPTKLRY